MMEVGAVFEDAYEIQSILGQGGFGIVYKAMQRTTGQLVAIKMLRLQASPARVERTTGRFLRETKLCAQLYHPNIVQLINAGKTAAGELYTVFAYAPGQSLSEVLRKEGALQPEEARHLMLEVLDALACAHALGIIHRDLKPGNIMVIPTGARRNALVLDFGLGTVVSDMDSAEQDRLTGTSDVVGTPGYAAPEQLNSLESTTATDLFSWGLVFLECLTGRPVYSGATLAEILFKQLGSEPLEIPAALQHHPLGSLLAEVTRKDPAARPKDAAALLRRVEACNMRGLSKAMITGNIPVPAAFSFVESMTIADTQSRADTALITVSERRQVTALCCDFKLLPRSSAPKENLEQHGAAISRDIEDINGALLSLLSACSKSVQKHRGFLAAAFGGQALFFFGYPVTDEQDGRRAARAAIAVMETIAAENAGFEPKGLRVEARIGLHAGLVVSPKSADNIDIGLSLTLGVTPTLASRIAAAAAPGAILVSGSLSRALRLEFPLEARGSLEGMGETHRLFMLQQEQTHAQAPVKKSSSQLIGRESELNMLVQRWTQAQKGAGQCSLILGEPGIGKSRLAQALSERIEESPHTMITLRSSPDAKNSPLFPFIDVMERLLDQEGGAAEADKLGRLETLLSRHGLHLPTQLPLFSALLAIPLQDRYAAPDISPELQKKRTFDAIQSLLFAMAETRPLFMLAEDLHWTDATTLELIARMIERVSPAPMYMVFTARPEFSQTSLPGTGVLQISLGRLGSDDTEALAAELFEGRDFPEEVLKQIIKRTDGVPLFIEEFAQMLIESGALVLRGDSYELERPLRDSDIPSSLRDLLTSRLDRLGKAKDTAQLAAALGREFSLSLLSAASERSLEDVQADLEKLLGAGLIQAKRKKDDKGYVFKHALIRDAAYESMALSARRKVHARVAAVLEERFGHIVEARPDLLAQHHAAAEQKQKAIEYAHKAAGGALRRSAYSEANAQVAQALPWVEALEDERERKTAELQLQSLSMVALMSTVGYGSPHLKTLTSRILELSDALGKSPHAFPTLYALSIYHHVISEREKALEIAERLVSLAKESGDIPQDMAAHAVLSQTLAMEGRYAEAKAATERALSLHDPARHKDLLFVYGVDPAIFALIMRGWTLSFMGYLDQGMAVCARSIAWARELHNPNMISLSLFYASYSHRLRGERQKVLDVTAEAIAIAERYGLEFNKAYSSMVRGWATRDLPEFTRVFYAHQTTGQVAGTPFLLSGLAEAEALEGELDKALAHIDEAVRFAEEQGDYFFFSGAVRLQGVFLLMKDPSALKPAEACFRRAIEIAQGQGAKTEELEAATELAGLLMKTGRAKEGYDCLSAIYGWFSEGLETPPLVSAKALLEQLHNALGATQTSIQSA